MQWIARIALGATVLTLAGCSSWQHTRATVVEPIHELLHHEYADAISDGERAAVEALFTEHGNLTPTFELIERFASIEQTRVAIDRVDRENEPVTAELSLVAEGYDGDGARMAARQNKIVTLAHSEDTGWRIDGDRPGPVAIVPTPPVRYVDEATERGLWFEHQSRSVDDPHGQPQRFIYGSGVAASDLDGNGWTDVVLVSGDTIELFLNREGSFARASGSWGLGEPLERVITAVLPIDVDNDGRRDLFVAAEQGGSLLYRNLGDRFEATEGHGIQTTQRSVAAVAADFDNDGWIDLFVGNHENVFWIAPDPPGSATNALPDQLFLNNRDGTFRDATAQSGIDNRGWTLSPTAADYDNDGDPDLFVGNDFGLDVLYRNDGDARFTEVSGEAGVDLPVASMSSDWGDYDGDGDLDLFVGGMRSGSGWVLEVPEFRIARVPRLVDTLFRPYVREAVRSWFRGNRLYQNQGDGRFVEIAAESGAIDSGWAWSSVFFDFDNDGALDIYAANGFISGPSEADI